MHPRRHHRHHHHQERWRQWHAWRASTRSLQGRMFWWFGLSILVTGFAALVVFSLVGRSGSSGWSEEVARARAFVGGQFARVWDDPVQRDALAADMARNLDLDVQLLDTQGRQLSGGVTQRCARGSFDVPVKQGGATRGLVRVCADRHHMMVPNWERWIIPFIVALLVLWGLSGAVARRLSWPLVELARVARDLGAGRLSSRAHFRWGGHAEVLVLADAFNDMAARIERQIADQRELLAAVSHELRTPLGHIRLLVELAREGAADPKPLDELDREVVEIDALVGQLLATSRLDFAALTMTRLDAAEIARRALERAGEEPSRLSVDAADTAFTADATLVSRALSNLVDNARKHGRGLERLRVKGGPGHVVFEVEDGGEGFAPGEESRAFQAFYRRPKGSNGESANGLGLGLALVKRTAEAHGGRVYAENRPEGGARVGMELPVSGAAEA